MPKLVAGVAAVLCLVPSACGGTSAASEGAGGGQLTLVSYSTPREVYEQLTRSFAETQAGAGVSFDESYGSSGEQSRAVESGLPADVLAFSLAPDVERLVEPGIVAADWADDEFDGMVTDSVVVLAVRKGNPKNIRGWADLVRDDVDVITPNPFTSGGARWNVMAAYGGQLENGRSDAEAIDYLRRLFANVSVQDKSARESLQTFIGGKGDVLIAYENEAIFAQQKGEELDYVVPDETILIENPVAVTEDAPAVARAFIEFIRSAESQRLFGEAGYRPVREDVLAEFDFPAPPKLFTIADLGGWEQVTMRYFDREDGVMAGINRELGQPTDS
jgi:sulfate/thiosulfate-binding protein